MIRRLNHVAIAVGDLASAMARYQDFLGAEISKPEILSQHGVRIAFVRLENCVIELMEPWGSQSPIRGFLDKYPHGGLHHLCYEVDDIARICHDLSRRHVRILGTGAPATGAHGKPVLFLHPKDFGGTLIELEQK